MSNSFSKTTGAPFEEVLPKVVEELKKESFGIELAAIHPVQTTQAAGYPTLGILTEQIQTKLRKVITNIYNGERT